KTPAVGRIADAEALRRRSVDAARLEPFNGRLVVLELRLEVPLRLPQQFEELVVAPRRPLAVFPRHLDPGNARQRLDRLREAQVLVFHEKAERRPVRPAAEAVIKALRGAYRERRGLLVVEGAAGLVFPAGFPELHPRADDLDDVGAADQV